MSTDDTANAPTIDITLGYGDRDLLVELCEDKADRLRRSRGTEDLAERLNMASRLLALAAHLRETAVPS